MVSYRKRGKVWQYEISYKDSDSHYKKLRKSGYKLKSDAQLAASQIQAYYIDIENYKAGKIPLSVYFERWINLYKVNSVSSITLIKYRTNLTHIRKLFGTMKLNEITRTVYQNRLNSFAQTHSIRTVKTLHKQIRSVILDALDEHYITVDPTRKIAINGLIPQEKPRSLDYTQWQALVKSLNPSVGADLIIYIAAVTGMRYGEIVGLTPESLDVDSRALHINKTWDYKYRTGFKPTKNTASNRVVSLDLKTTDYLQSFIENKASNEPIFMEKNHIMVSYEINQILTQKLRTLGIPRITFHGLRHTHASILLYQGVSVLSVSKRLGHSSINTTQSTYLHIIKELEAEDTAKIVKILESI